MISKVFDATPCKEAGALQSPECSSENWWGTWNTFWGAVCRVLPLFSLTSPGQVSTQRTAPCSPTEQHSASAGCHSRP